MWNTQKVWERASLKWVVVCAVFLTALAVGAQQQTTGTPGSPSATTTVPTTHAAASTPPAFQHTLQRAAAARGSRQGQAVL